MQKNEVGKNATLVSIGMPVFNEGTYLETSLQSLVEQTYPNIEIIISDNYSSDNTESICREYAKKYTHIRYTRLSENVGIAENFRNVQRLAAGKYFMWASGHDLWSSNCIHECVNMLENNKIGVIAFASSCWIDGDGKLMDKCSGWTDTRGMDCVARFFTILWGNMHPILGLINNDILKEIDEFKGIVGADLVLLSELAMRGHFIHADKALWSRRSFREPENYQQRISRYKSKNYKLVDETWKNYFPIISLPYYICKIILKSDLKFHVKFIVFLTLFPTMLAKYFVSK